jgi:hypothetical protein
MSTAALSLVLVVVLMSSLLNAAPAPAAASSLAEKLAQLDALHGRRDDPAALASARRLADAVIAEAPGDYDVLWRAARVLFTASDEPSAPAAERSRLGKQGYDIALRAIGANPNRVEGHYWAALSIGSYAEEMGVLHALAAGIEGKFKRPLERATALDVAYDHGNIPAVWAAYYLELPWPKRDRAKAAQYLRQALAINPSNLRAHLYQARIAIDEHRPAEAKALLAEIAAAPVGRYDPPEERRVKKEAAAMAAGLR